MQIDTIVTDLDDTLLSDHTMLTPFTLDVLQEAKRRGIRVIPASGRAATSMRPFVDQLQIGHPYIACNGAQLLNPDHTEISSVSFSPRQAQALIRYYQDRGLYAQVYRGDYFYFDRETEANRVYSAQTGMQGIAVGDLIPFLTFETPKVLCIHKPEEIERLLPVVQEAFPELSFTISKPYFLEAQCKDVSKGSAVAKLSEILAFSPAHTLVCGDSLNDISMFDFTENSVAMRNGRAEVKHAARYITEFTNAQDGLARFIQTHVLG